MTAAPTLQLLTVPPASLPAGSPVKVSAPSEDFALLLAGVADGAAATPPLTKPVVAAARPASALPTLVGRQADADRGTPLPSGLDAPGSPTTIDVSPGGDRLVRQPVDTKPMRAHLLAATASVRPRATTDGSIPFFPSTVTPVPDDDDRFADDDQSDRSAAASPVSTPSTYPQTPAAAPPTIALVVLPTDAAPPVTSPVTALIPTTPREARAASPSALVDGAPRPLATGQSAGPADPSSIPSITAPAQGGQTAMDAPVPVVVADAITADAVPAPAETPWLAARPRPAGLAAVIPPLPAEPPAIPSITAPAQGGQTATGASLPVVAADALAADTAPGTMPIPAEIPWLTDRPRTMVDHAQPVPVAADGATSPAPADRPASITAASPDRAVGTTPSLPALAAILIDRASVGTTAPAAQAFAAAILAADRQDRFASGHRLTTPDVDAASAVGLAGIQTVTATAPTGNDQPSLDMRHQGWPTAMVDHIERLRDAADAGSTRIRVVPDALGSIDVSVRRHDGGVQVALVADQPATRALIAQAQPDLARLGEQRGLRLDLSLTGGGNQTGSDQRRPTPVAAPIPAIAAASPPSDDPSDPADGRVA